MKKAGKIFIIILLCILGIMLIGFIIMLIKSPGKLEPLKNINGVVIGNSISEKNFIEIGGLEQGFFIRSENPQSPVILYLHGGPGSPELPMTISYETNERLEKYFTVCYWDQRGAGMSYDKSLDPADMTVGRMVEDTREMTEYLKQRFGKDKIYLMGHSWGSFLGIKTIEKYPENYIAYIGIGQVTHQQESERIAYDYMIEQATILNNRGDVKDLEKYDKNDPGFPGNDYLLKVRTRLMNKYGIGIMHDNFSMTDLVKDVVFFKGYTLKDKINYIRGSMFSLDNVFHYVISDNLFESSNSFEVPVYVTHGRYDYQVSHDLAEKYMDIINAPDKQFFTFENSAHSPNMEEPEEFVRVIREIASRF